MRLFETDKPVSVKPIAIAQVRIARAVQSVPEKAIVIPFTQPKPTLDFRLGWTVILAVAILIGIGNIFYVVVYPVGNKLFTLNDAAFNPGIMVKCKFCERKLFNATAEEAFQATCFQDRGCMFCKAPNGLTISAVCPSCGKNYVPQTAVKVCNSASGVVNSAGIIFACDISAVCPHCGEVLIRKESVVIVDEP